MAKARSFKPRLTGPFFDLKHEAAIRGMLRRTAEAHGPKQEAAVKAAAPVAKADREKGSHKAGTLRDSIKSKISVTKRRITLTVTSDALNPKGIPYGNAQNAKGPNEGFIDDALAEQAEVLLGSIQAETLKFMADLNAGRLPSPA